MKKRITSFIVAIVTLVGIFSSSIEVQAKSFPDVPRDSWYWEYVDYVSNKGIMTGYNDGKFGPLNMFLRAEVATTFYKMSGSPSVQYRQYFPDVTAQHPMRNGVTWCYEKGIMTGYENGYFGPDSGMTREQFATILYRYAKFRGKNVSANGNLNAFPDANKVSSFAVDGMKFAIQYGIISGDQGMLNPQGIVNRAVAATILCRYDSNVFYDQINRINSPES